MLGHIILTYEFKIFIHFPSKWLWCFWYWFFFKCFGSISYLFFFVISSVLFFVSCLYYSGLWYTVHMFCLMYICYVWYVQYIVLSFFNILVNWNPLQAVCTQKADSTDVKKLDFRDAEDQPGLSSQAFRRRSVSDTWTFIRQRSKCNSSIILITFQRILLIMLSIQFIVVLYGFSIIK